jgi:TolA-binding protein
MANSSPAFQYLFAGQPAARGSRGYLRVLLAALLILPLAACATKRDVRDMRETVVELHAQNQALLRELQREQRVQQDSIGALARGMLDSRGESARRLTNIEDNLLLVQELLGVSQQQLSALRDQVERDRAQPAFGGGVGPGMAPAGGSGAARQLYDGGVSAFNRGLFSTARLAFMDIVELHGNDPLVPQARFYLAEILVEEGQPEEAIEAFLRIPEFHPGADNVPNALYRAGMLHLELGNRSVAEEYLDRVVNTWPDSMPAELARETLRTIR